MAAALAHSRPGPQVPGRSRGGMAPVALRVAHPHEQRDTVDLDAAWAAATAPHRIAEERDAHVAEVIPLHRDHRAVSPRVRRNRVAAILSVLALAVVLALGAGVLGADADGPTAVGDTVTVQPGQTLWDVAVAHTAAGGDARATLDDIRELNGLAGTEVPAWTSVVLPASLD